MPIWGSNHKIPIVWGLNCFQASKYILTGRLMHANSTGMEAPALRTLQTSPYIISSSGCSSVSFIISFNKVANIWVSLSSVSHSNKLTELRWGSWRPPCSQIGQKLWVTWGPTCDWHLNWVAAVLWDWALNLCDLTVYPKRYQKKVSELS